MNRLVHPSHDVAVVGAGIAGLAACVLLRDAGLKVVCLDGRPYPHQKVGESLDWSSPGLLRRVGIDTDTLLDAGIATCKKNIVVSELGRTAPWQAAPPPMIKRRPLRFETVTLHVDREALDLRLYERARVLGAEFIWERVREAALSGNRITSLSTDAGRTITARWYLDASGTGRFLSRAMDIPITLYGRRKVCLWTYFETPPLYEGTAFFVDNRDRYLAWIWDIPISPTRTSVGLVLPADAMRDERHAGTSVEATLRERLARHRRFDALLGAQGVTQVERTSFQPYVTSKVCGDNWLLIGEAASMPDPLTGNGVTSGIRHARHAVDAILAAGTTPALPARRQRDYERHVSRLGHAFNAHIERAVYSHPLRWGFGLRTATYVYTFFAFFMNALHARFDPRGRVGMAVFAVLFAGARAWISGWSRLAGIVLRLRPAPHGASSSGGR